MTDVCIGGLVTSPGSDRVFKNVSGKQGIALCTPLRDLKFLIAPLPRALDHVAR